ncbi:bifunctional oligoribonuclease/PAP phosphatase NrnA [Flaviaesturariibacter flavus]|uniref:Bifunctional oligoribonuclease/PAP phosphatase NrnA n=1 Tax=Flaviaesturariibacter flavus TaxID=2502780 RepID=A0A4R1BN59_9BACT|nr:DHH family phosphoesterase [Flaviaesturariibacter flavus]TCJ18963.1 bifunctional oligoribonuclease/PAP phosphatase NrnA [Flaviaesturariibacter flavus]
MQAISEIYPLLAGPARRIAITMHQKPDADAMGSTLGLRHVLVQLGHTVQVISPTNWARWVDWMPGAKDVLDYELHRAAADAWLDSADWLFCLDFNHMGRTKNMAPKLTALKCVKVLIDHHQEPDEAMFTYGVSDTSKSSTCEMVYDFIVGAGLQEKINDDAAQCLYAGVVADTGSFRFSSTGASVHHMVGYLKERGLDHTKIHEALYDNYLENRLRFLGHVLMNRMEVIYELNTALISIPKADLLKFDIKTGDTEGLVNYPLSIQGIKLVGLCIDRDEERKWSFRSKGEFDCNTFARRYFEGGGHFNAAGGRDSLSLSETVRRFREAINENSSVLQ